MNYDKLENIFFEIQQGFSEVNFQENLLYFKHPGMIEFEHSRDQYNAYYEIAKKKKIPTEKELKKSLEEDSIWTKKEEDNLEGLKVEVKNLEQTLKNLIKESEKYQIKKRLKKQSEKLNELQKVKDSLFKVSAEKYAKNKSTEAFIQKLFYKDAKLKELFWSDEEFKEINFDELDECYQLYHRCADKFCEKNLQQIAISGTFKNLLNLFDKNVSNFFNKNHLELSYYQINLLNLGKLFISIFDNKDIPENIRNDAEAIIKFLEDSSVKKDKVKKMTEQSRNKDGFSVAGASKKDLKELGIKQQGDDIHEIAKDKGGELSMEDFMQIHKK